MSQSAAHIVLKKISALGLTLITIGSSSPRTDEARRAVPVKAEVRILKVFIAQNVGKMELNKSRPNMTAAQGYVVQKLTRIHLCSDDSLGGLVRGGATDREERNILQRGWFNCLV